MSLDMDAYRRDGKLPALVDFEPEDNDVLIHYWRKHPALHGWMEALYFSKKGRDVDGMEGPDSFNCVPVELTLDDLVILEKELGDDCLPQTFGPFFGKSQPEDEADTLKFIAKARAAIADGASVYYMSWW